jgi:hypothetical protein
LRSRPMTDAAESLLGFISEFGSRFIRIHFDGMDRGLQVPRAMSPQIN